MATETYKGKATRQYPSRSNVDITHSREDDVGVVDSVLHNSYMAWELSKGVLLLQDMVEQKGHPMDDIIVGLFLVLIEVSLPYLFLFLPISQYVPD